MAKIDCIYCSKRLGMFSQHECYIFPKILYMRLKALRYIHGPYSVKYHDKRNKIITCGKCELSTHHDMLIPDWSIDGIFKYFEDDELHAYADYFYTLSYPLMHMFKEAIPAPGAEESMLAIEAFRLEYEWRVSNNIWELGSIYPDAKDNISYRKSAIESRYWWERPV